MATYLLTGIDDDLWRRFKASCDLQGVTCKEVLLRFINTRDIEFMTQHNYHKAEDHKPEKGGKKK